MFIREELVMVTILDLSSYRLIQFSEYNEFLNSRSRMRELFQENRNTGLTDKDILLKGFSLQDIEYIKDNKDIWLNLARKQWKHINTQKKAKKESCDLCNTKHNLMCYIRNKKNGKIINVGGICVETLGDDISKEHGGLIKNAQEAYNFQKIQETLPKIRSTAEKWNDYLKTTSLIAPNFLTSEYMSIGRKIKDILRKAIKTTNNDHYIKELRSLVGRGTNIKIKIKNYCESYKDEKYIITRELYEDMKKNQPQQCNKIIEILSKEPVVKVNYQTAHRINSEIFLNQVQQEFNSLLKTLNIDYVQNGQFYLSFHRIKGIIFKVSSSNFLQVFGELIFKNIDKNFSEENAVKEIVEYVSFDMGKSKIDVYEQIDKKLTNQYFQYKRYHPETDYKLNGVIKQKIEEIGKKQHAKKELERLSNLIYSQWENTQKNNDVLDNIFDSIMLFSGLSLKISLLSQFKVEFIKSRMKFFLKYNNFTRALEKIAELYDILDQPVFSNKIRDLNRNSNLEKDSEARYEIERLLTYEVYLSDKKVNKELEELKDKILDYHQYKHDYVDYVNTSMNEDKIYRVRKEDYLNIGKYLLLFDEEIYSIKLLNEIKASEKVNRDNYRKHAMISLESSKIAY